MPKRLTTEEFQLKINKLYNNKYRCLDDYNGTYKPLHFNCPIHGIFERSPRSMIARSDCPKCIQKRNDERIRNLTKTTEEFIIEAKKLHGERFSYENTVYVNNDTDVEVICPIHGSFLINPRYHLRGGGCKKCSFPVYSTESFINEAIKVHGDNYDYSESVYKHSKEKLKIKCKKCGAEFWQLPPEHIRGYGCPYCHQSKLEAIVEKLLINNNIEFIKQTHDFGLGLQSLDFFLPQYNIAIECQGIQHFSNHPFFYHSKDEFEKSIERDINKFNKCKEQNIAILYFTKQEWLPNDIFENSLFQGIYNKNNVFLNENDLLNEVNSPLPKGRGFLFQRHCL